MPHVKPQHETSASVIYEDVLERLTIGKDLEYPGQPSHILNGVVPHMHLVCAEAQRLSLLKVVRQPVCIHRCMKQRNKMWHMYILRSPFVFVWQGK